MTLGAREVGRVAAREWRSPRYLLEDLLDSVLRL